MHYFPWVLNAPILTANNKEITFVNDTIHAILPDKNQTLNTLVKSYQLYEHSRACQEYNYEVCRLNFRRFFTKQLIDAGPVPVDMPKYEKNLISQEKKEAFSKVKDYVSINLNFLKVKFFTLPVMTSGK